MVWGAIWLDERGRALRSNLVIMERDLNAKNRGYSAQSYIEALNKGLFPIGNVHSYLCRMGRAYIARASSDPSSSFTALPTSDNIVFVRLEPATYCSNSDVDLDRSIKRGRSMAISHSIVVHFLVETSAQIIVNLCLPLVFHSLFSPSGTSDHLL